MTKVSIIVPLYNEEGNVKALHEEIKTVCEENHYLYEIIFIDDGSTDKTAEIAKQLVPLTLIEFKKNFGQTSSLLWMVIDKMIPPIFQNS
jgi:glycosyltransferase involved in cell wall biosynthesis